MNQNFVKVIGINDESRNNAYIAYINQVEGLKDILDNDFEEWSDFDCWENIGAQRWIFQRALDVFRGKKIDIQCECCEVIDLNQIEDLEKRLGIYKLNSKIEISNLTNEFQVAVISNEKFLSLENSVIPILFLTLI